MTERFDFIPDADQVRAQQADVSYGDRPVEAQRLATLIREGLSALDVSPRALTDDGDRARLETLRHDGCVGLGPLLSADEVATLKSWLLPRPVYLGHVETQSRGYADNYIRARQAKTHYAGYPLADCLNAPYLLELANSPRLTTLAEHYLGCPPTLYSFNIFWTFPVSTGERTPYLTFFHRDQDDYNFLSVFVPLTDVSEANGRHEYLRGTHKPAVFEQTLAKEVNRLTETEGSTAVDDLFARMAAPETHGDAIKGIFRDALTADDIPAGHGLMEDVFGYHRGAPALSEPRLMAWFRYGLYANSAYHNDGHRPVDDPAVAARLPDGLRAQYVNRLLVRPPSP